MSLTALLSPDYRETLLGRVVFLMACLPACLLSTLLSHKVRCTNRGRERVRRGKRVGVGRGEGRRNEGSGAEGGKGGVKLKERRCGARDRGRVREMRECGKGSEWGGTYGGRERGIEKLREREQGREGGLSPHGGGSRRKKGGERMTLPLPISPGVKGACVC